MPRCCGASSVSAMDDDGSPQSLGLQIQDGNPRNKTALAPGHSLMDWIRLGNSGVDLTGVGGVPRIIGLTELAKHNKQNDAWIAIRGIVFNVTRYMDFHPGGVEELMKGVGKDATKLFENVHAWVNYQSILQKCVVGRLSRASSTPTSITTTTEEKTDTSNSPVSTTSNPIEDRTKEEEAEKKRFPKDAEKLTPDWRQTSSSITLFYRSARDYPGLYYRLTRHDDSKLLIELLLEKNTIGHELVFPASIEWPPTWQRNFDTMEVDFTFRKKTREIWKSRGNHVSSIKSCATERTYKEYEVLDNAPLCKIVHLLLLRAKGSLELVPIGRHVEARMNVMGMEVSRYYTPVPPCLHPDDLPTKYSPDCVCLIIKRYPDGALSPSITALRPGQTLTLSNALGAFVVESYDHYSHLHMLAAGTGLTAMLGIIQRSLARRAVTAINLVHFNKDEDNMFYVTQLDKVCASQKLKVTHVLSQATSSWSGKRGAMSDELLKDLVGTSSPNGCVFTCGPRGFMQTAKTCLQKLNWKPEQMYEFDD